jgi:hypothetical protein
VSKETFVMPSSREQQIADPKSKGLQKSPEELYKISSTDTKFFRQNAIELLLHDRVRLSSPSEFNDPVDSMVDTSDSVKTDYDALRESYGKPEWDDESLLSSHDWVMQQFGIYCLSQTAAEPLMWAHYGDSHRGISWVFRFMRQRDFLPEQVDYVDEPLACRICDVDCLIEGIRRKGRSWSYEEEWRVVEPLGAGKWVAVPPGMLTAVILGARCSSDDANFLVDLIKRRTESGRQPVQLRSAVLSPKTFAVSQRSILPSQLGQITSQG